MCRPAATNVPYQVEGKGREFFTAPKGAAAAEQVGLIVWCKSCDHRSEPDPAEQARWYGPELPGPEWRTRLVCSRCGSRDVDMVVSGRGGGSTRS
jgi:hypothetical protein